MIENSESSKTYHIRVEEALKLNEERLEALLKLSQMKEVSEKELTDFALEECVRLTQSKVGYLHFFNEDQNSLRLYNWSREVLKGCTAEKTPHYPLEEAGVWADCVRLRKPIIHNDYQNLPDKKGYPEGHFLVIRHMSVPVFDGDKIVAVVGVGNKEKPYDDSDVNQLFLFMDNMWRIVKQKRAEDALLESSELYRTLMKTSPDAVMVTDLDGFITEVSQRTLELHGFENVEQLLGKHAVELIAPEDHEAAIANLQKTLKEGTIRNAEYTLLRKDGSRFIGELNADVIKDAHGKPKAFIATTRDITERKKMEKQLKEYTDNLEKLIEERTLELRESEERYRGLYFSMSEGVALHKIIYDEQGDAVDYVIVDVNSSYELITDLKRDRAIGRRASELYGTDTAPYLDIFAKVAVNGQPALFETYFPPMDKHFSISVFSPGKGQFATVFTDISERKKMEDALAAEKERLAVTLRSIGDGVIATNVDEKIILMNKIAEELTGWSQEEVIGKPLSEIFHILNEESRKPFENPVQSILENGGALTFTDNVILISRDGTERVLANSGAPIRDKDSVIIGVVLVFSDVTEKRKMEEELQKIQKFESLSIVAGGIAHDFNNFLTAILSNITLARLYADFGDKMIERLTEAEKASMRAKDLTQQLLTFSKGGALIKKTASIEKLLKETTQFALSGSAVNCDFSIPDNLWTVEIDEGKIGQVIHNLIINAEQAMPEGGSLEIKVENVVSGTEDGLPLKAGKYVKLTIKDQGIGIPKENLTKIFDPYFTTKEGGSGLGLAITYSIINKHDGYIMVESEEGVGTTFYLYLPASEKQILVKQEALKGPITGEGKILVMDDEEIIREVVGEILAHLGYQVELARNGEEAIVLYKKAKDMGRTFNAVIMDLTIRGGMGGKETIRKLLEIDPKVKALVSSGYSQDPVMVDFTKYGFSGVVYKPYNIEELSETLRKVIMDG